MIRLVCIDVDGTLLGSGGQVLPRVWDAIARARASGLRLALASGRPAFGVTLDYAKRLDPDGWHIFQNGASVVNVGTGASSSAILGPDIVDTLIAEARATGRILELYSDSDYVSEGAGAWPRQHAELLAVPYVERRFESLRGSVVRAQWLVPHAEVSRLTVLAGVETVTSVSPVMADTSFVVVTAAGVTKGAGACTVANAYGFAMADTMAVGDAANDLPAMRIVGYPVAMGNAEAEVKACARWVVGHVDAGGLVEALDRAIANTVAQDARHS